MTSSSYAVTSGARRHQLSLETKASVGLQRLVLVLPTLRSATTSWRPISA